MPTENDQATTHRLSSPEYLQLSLAAAMTLNLKAGLFFRNARLYCLNLLLTYPSGCRGNCSYCGLQKSRDGGFSEKSFIRVTWPTYDLETVIQKTLENRPKLHRVCLSMITHPRALEDTLFLIRRFREEVGLPISVLMNPTSMKTGDVAALRQAGAQMAAVALDLPDEALFDRHRGSGVKGPHRFEHYWSMLTATVEVFGKNKAGCHLICGMGEREEDLIRRIQAVRDLGARTHLFSFYPEKGSRLAEASSCPAGRYRRVQLARFLIDNDLSRSQVMAFDEAGRIKDFGLPPEVLEPWIDSGRPFMTSGCPGGGLETACNRPFGDGPPSDIRSFPFPLEAEDLARVKEQMGWGRPTDMDDVVGCGSLNVDYIYETEDLTFLEPFYPEGKMRREWVLTDPLEIRGVQEAIRKKTRLISRTGGGSAANTVFSLAKMGFLSGLAGKIGQDEDGDFILKEMAPIPRLNLGRNQRTGTALIILGPDRDRIILLLPNANRELIWADLDPDFVRTFRILHLTSIPGEGLALQERLAREVAGPVQISFDPGEVYVHQGLKKLVPLLVLSQILFITQGELELLTGREWRDGVKEILDLGTRIIAVKKKGSGAFIQEAAGVWELPAPVIRAKDTTGAGDVFAAGFLGGYLRGLPLPACGSLGLSMAHQSMGEVGREAYPQQEDFERAVGRLR